MNYIQKIWADVASLQQKTKGKGVKIAILDGSIELTHPCFVGSQLSFVENNPSLDLATDHGTHVASILLSTAEEKLQGICPEVECVSIPIFRARENGHIVPSSQLELARAIEMALSAGADIINISAGEKVINADPQQRLQKVIEQCVQEQVLLVSAVGNDGCPCIHIPAIHPSVLAVGALDIKGLPTSFSNWGAPYQFNGIMAPGEAIVGANPKGGYTKRNGTSFATPIVTGVVALLYSYFKHHTSLVINPLQIKTAILDSAFGCPIEEPDNQESCDRFLHGILNVSGAVQLLQNKIASKDNSVASSKEEKLKESSASYKLTVLPQLLKTATTSSWIFPSTDNYIKQTELPLVYAVGVLGVDYKTDAIKDSFEFYMKSLFREKGIPIDKPDPYNPQHLFLYLKGGGKDNTYDATRVTWILKINNSPVYALEPTGAFSQLIYQQLIKFLQATNEFKEELLDKQLKYRIELCSIAGHVVGSTTLRSGAVLPVINPNNRVLYNWIQKDLMEDIALSSEQSNRKIRGVEVINLIDRLAARLLFKLEHFGLSPKERALNHVATNLYNLGNTFAEKLAEGYEMDDIQVEESIICRPESICQDVILTFFKPSERLKEAKHVFRLTVDVSQVIPVTVGDVHEWFDY